MTAKERNLGRFFNSRTFDEANYYQGISFEIGGSFYQSDERLQEEAWNVLRGKLKSDLGNIEVVVHNGVIKLVGSVDYVTDKWKAESSIDEIPGVVNILNELRVRKLFG